MKKIISLILLSSLLLSMVSCGKNSEEAPTSGSSLTPVTDTAKEDSSAESTSGSGTSYGSSLGGSDKDLKSVESAMKNVILSVSNIQIDSLTVMKANLSADSGYKAYAILTWKGAYSPSDSQQILQTYSNSIAGSTDAKLGNVQSLSLTWLVPNLSGSASLLYDKTDGLLDLSQEAFDQSFGTPMDDSSEADGSDTSTSDSHLPEKVR